MANATYYIFSTAKNSTSGSKAKTVKLFNKGELISKHANYLSASNKQRSLNRKVGYEFDENIVLIEFDSDQGFVVGESYPDITDGFLEEQNRKRLTYLLVDIIESEQTSDVLDKKHIARLEAFEVTLDELKNKYTEDAIQLIDERSRIQQEKAELVARKEALAVELEDSRSELSYAFPAVRGIQAGKEYFIAQIPYKALVKLFSFDSEDLPPELRAQRVLSEPRAKKIAEYVNDNPDSYILPALTATVSAHMSFDAVSAPGASNRIGVLYVPMDSQILINDGQHRRRGIELALKENPDLGEETAAVSIYYDQGLKHSQQIFSDINSSAVKPAKSISQLYNKRDGMNSWILELLDLMPQLKSRIDMENSSVRSNSHKLFSLVSFTKFVSHLTKVNSKNFDEKLGDSDLKEMTTVSVVKFIEKLDGALPAWSAMIKGTVAASEARLQYVTAHAVFLEALGILGSVIINHQTASFDALDKLDNLDVNRSSVIWNNRSVVLGRIVKTSHAVNATAAVLVTHTGLELTPELFRAEDKINAQTPLAVRKTNVKTLVNQ